MSAHTRVRLGRAIALILLLACTSGSQPPAGDSRARLRASGERAAARGAWVEAFERYADLQALAPDAPDIASRCTDAAHHAVQALTPDTAPPPSARLLRWLSSVGDLDLLAQALDRSVARVPGGEF